jgi:heat shock protein HslJ
VLDLDGRNVRGNGGCNNFFGSYKQKQELLTFSAMGSTMKNCPAGMDTEYNFISGLEKVTHYRISGQVMELYTESGIWARFEAVYF